MTIPDILERYGIDHRKAGEHHHVRHGWVGVDCPRCSPGSGRFKLGVNLERNFANCWSCGGVRLGDALSELTGRPITEVLELLGRAGRLRSQALPVPTARGRLMVPKGVAPMQNVHRKYLASRGFDPPEIERLWGVQGIGLASRLAWRLFLPIVHQGKTVSWTTRAIGKSGRRYMSASPAEETINHKTLLYGEDYCRRVIIVCEGPVDAWRIGPGTVATFGLTVSLSQVRRIAEYPVRVIAFDDEPEAQRRAKGLATMLNGIPGETHVVQVESGMDWGEADREEVIELRGKYLDG